MVRKGWAVSVNVWDGTWTDSPYDRRDIYPIDSYIDSSDFINQLHRYQSSFNNLSNDELYDILGECIDFINDMQDELDEVVEINNSNVSEF
jgi:hypothetical protein